MRVIDADVIDRALDVPSLIEALSDAFRGGYEAPARHHHALPGSGSTLLLMPAWMVGEAGFTGVKVVSVTPANASRGLPSVLGSYLLLDGPTGAPLACLDGARLTLWRTAAASALASRVLAEPHASRLLLVGAGALAPFLARAHASVLPIREVQVWARRADAAAELAGTLTAEGLPARPAGDLAEAAAQADLISCATLSKEALIRGEWLRPGTHLDLVGAFAPDMREADDEALRRAAVFVDTPGALQDGGDVAVAIRTGAIDRSAVRGDLADLVSGRVGRPSEPGAITAFKSVGAAIEDLAAAALVWRRVSGHEAAH